MEHASSGSRNSSWRDLDILVAVALLSCCQNAVALLCQNSELACLVPVPLSLLLERLWGAVSQCAVTLGRVLPAAYLRSKIFDVVRDLRLGNDSLLRTNPRCGIFRSIGGALHVSRVLGVICGRLRSYAAKFAGYRTGGRAVLGRGVSAVFECQRLTPVTAISALAVPLRELIQRRGWRC